MDTLQEALFRAMLNDGWFTDSDGNVDSPTGYFGYVVNDRSDWSSEFLSEFEETIAAYAPNEFDNPDQADIWIRNNFVGVYSAYINSDGIISIYKHGGYVRTPGVAVLGIEKTRAVEHAMLTFSNRQGEYREWADSDDYQGGN